MRKIFLFFIGLIAFSACQKVEEENLVFRESIQNPNGTLNVRGVADYSEFISLVSTQNPLYDQAVLMGENSISLQGKEVGNAVASLFEATIPLLDVLVTPANATFQYNDDSTQLTLNYRLVMMSQPEDETQESVMETNFISQVITLSDSLVEHRYASSTNADQQGQEFMMISRTPNNVSGEIKLFFSENATEELPDLSTKYTRNADGWTVAVSTDGKTEISNTFIEDQNGNALGGEVMQSEEESLKFTSTYDKAIQGGAYMDGNGVTTDWKSNLVPFHLLEVFGEMKAVKLTIDQTSAGATFGNNIVPMIQIYNGYLPYFTPTDEVVVTFKEVEGYKAVSNAFEVSNTKVVYDIILQDDRTVHRVYQENDDEVMVLFLDAYELNATKEGVIKEPTAEGELNHRHDYFHLLTLTISGEEQSMEVLKPLPIAEGQDGPDDIRRQEFIFTLNGDMGNIQRHTNVTAFPVGEDKGGPYHVRYIADWTDAGMHGVYTLNSPWWNNPIEENVSW